MTTRSITRTLERSPASPTTPSRRHAPVAGVPERQRIAQPYLLVLLTLPFCIDAAGRRHIDPLWAKDLAEHARYIEQLTLAAPAMHGAPPAGWVAMDEVEALRRVRCVDLPLARGYISAFRQLPRLWRRLWPAWQDARIVHSGVAAWPLPEAWVLAPLMWLRPRLHYINVESAAWRVVPGEVVSRTRRLVAWATEKLNQRALRAADLSTFTHESYRRGLQRHTPLRGHVVEASWIDDADILSPAALNAALMARAAVRPLRLVFAGRLTQAKGILPLLDVVASLVRAGHAIELDVFGDGPLAEVCAARIVDPELALRIRLRGQVAYGAAFFATLRDFHALVVPSLSDEQPRVVFDACSQGLPVLASDTAGLRQCVTPGRTGLVFERGNAAALAAAILGMAADRAGLAAMADACIRQAREKTHRSMHAERLRLLLAAFPALARR